MNKPFSFRSEAAASDGGGNALAQAGVVSLKVRWGRPVAFDFTPRLGDNDSQPLENSILQVYLPPDAANGASHKPVLKARLLPALRSGLLALALVPLAASAQSLWKDDVSKPMFADKRAAGVGDILTILVQESTSSSKDNKTATGKESGLDASLATFLYSPMASGFLTKGGQMPAMKFNSKSDFSGGGSINNSEKLSARAAVVVKDVLPNRNLVIEGRRETMVGGEQQTMILHGVVRPEDVLANNTVYSYNIAEAGIQIVSKGTLTDSQRKGWFHKIWDKVSPF